MLLPHQFTDSLQSFHTTDHASCSVLWATESHQLTYNKEHVYISKSFPLLKLVVVGSASFLIQVLHALRNFRLLLVRAALKSFFWFNNKLYHFHFPIPLPYYLPLVLDFLNYSAKLHFKTHNANTYYLCVKM